MWPTGLGRIDLVVGGVQSFGKHCSRLFPAVGKTDICDATLNTFFFPLLRLLRKAWIL
jgi:hypothetical protein